MSGAAGQDEVIDDPPPVPARRRAGRYRPQLAATPSPAPPRHVRWAGLALWIVAALYAATGLLSLFTRATRADALRRTGTTLTEAEIDSSVTLRIVVTCAFALALAGLAAFSALNVPRGRRWARTSGTVVVSVAAATALVRSFAGEAPDLVGAAVLVASFATVVLLYRRQANTFFAAGGRGN